MKVGILSQPLIHNYGGTLQNYALQYILHSLCHEAITINWGISESWSKWLIKFLIAKSRGLETPKSPSSTCRRDKYFRDFYKSYIERTKPMGTLNIDRILKKSYDAYIVGSDQVWRKDYNPNIEHMFLDFVPDEAIKIAYAASIGIDVWDYSEDLTKSCISLVNRFKAISVREETAIQLLRDNLNAKSELVLDPTLLMSLKDYELNLKLKPQNETNCIAVYILDMTKEKEFLLKEISELCKCEIDIIGNPEFYGNFEKRASLQYPSPQDWLCSIRDAKYVITDSFHGTAFSINFHRKFITLGNLERGNTRFDSLLNVFGLENRLVNIGEKSSDIFSIMSQEIDWNSIDSIRSKLIEKSINFLKNNLNA
jgi:putative murB family protein